MIKITAMSKDVKGRAARIGTIDEATNETSEIVLSAEFCHFCKDDLAQEFAEFMKAKGYDIAQGKANA